MRAWCVFVLFISPAFGDACEDVAPSLVPVEVEGVRFLAEPGGAVRAIQTTSNAELWRITPPGIGENWSMPTIARVRFGGTARLVVIVSGGYSEEANVGNRLFMLDATTGSALWVAANPRMAYAIPARVAAIDTDGDALADRLYVPDLGGQLWRFDLWDDVVAGGVLASLGPRRFFQAPDVAFSGEYANLAFGTGDRRAPGLTGTLERFYSIRDRRPFGKMTQAEYDALTPILDEDLSAEGTPLGWKLDLRPGEKVLAESITADGTILFSTYMPASTCGEEGTASVYALQLDSGTPALVFGSAPLALSQAGLSGELKIAIDAATRRSSCWVGAEQLPVCVTMPRLIRTFWQRGR
jgi:Tfp pilus tip-associated adhesin PilY1